MEESRQGSDPKSEARVEVILHRIYTKTSLFEAANYALSFIEKPPQPVIEQQISVNAYPKEGNLQEAVLSIQLTAKYQDNLLWRIQLQQAGLYTMKNVPEAECERVLYGFCMNQLYPFACNAITQLITQGGFSPIYLAPMNFEQLYQQQKQQKGQSNQ